MQYMFKNNNQIIDLVNRHGSPLYIYDEKMINLNFNKLKNAFSRFDIFYSFKSNPNVFLCTNIKSIGGYADAASIGEVKKAIECGFTRDQIIYSSPGKKREEIEVIIGKCIIIADSIEEIKMINSICKSLGIVENIGVRINPKYTIKNTDALEVMSGLSSKFGIDQERFEEGIDLINTYNNINVNGIQIYMGSQKTDYNIISNNFFHILDIAKTLIEKFKLNLEYIDFGGGFGIQYTKKDEYLDIDIAGLLVNQLLETDRFKDISHLRLIIESGRYISGTAGIYVAKVLDVKESRGKKYAIIDGGMNTFFRPVFIKDNKYPIRVIKKEQSGLKEVITLAGVMCTPIDIFVEDIKLPVLSKGDIVVFYNTGAYGYTMSLTKFISQQEAKELYVTVDNKILTIKE